MKKLLLATTAFVGFATGALAADPPRAFVPVVAPAFTWTGVYVGLNAGAFWGDNDDDRFGPSSITIPAGAGGPGSAFTGFSTTANPLFNGLNVPITPFAAAGVPLPLTTVVPLGGACAGCGGDRNTSAVFGAQIGYNHQFTPGAGLVLGFELDAQFVGWDGDSNRRGVVTGRTVTSPAFVGAPPVGVFGTGPFQLGPNTFTFFDPRESHREDADWLATVRLRLGYGFDRWLVYATGGLAFLGGGEDNRTVTIATHAGNLTTRNPFCPGSCGEIKLGWTLGGGVEYAFGHNWSVKVEGLYVNVDHDRSVAGGSLPYAVMTGVGVAGGPATDRILFSAPASAFSPRGNGGDENFFILRAGVNYRFATR